jgi:CRISPR-associated protein (TIGR03984 family)
MTREKITVAFDVKGPFSVQDSVGEIHSQAASGRFAYLLAYADDGVIWGMLRDKKWILSGDEGAFPQVSPVLRAQTLWEARLFGKDCEWMIWKTEAGFMAREIADGQGQPRMAFDEAYILWGTDNEETRGPFTLLREADLGIRHAPPITWKGRHQARLEVRHYLAHDSQGAAYIRLSRLVGLNNSGGAQ